MHAYTHTNIHTYIHTGRQAGRQAGRQSHTYIHTYVHTYIQTDRQTYIHTWLKAISTQTGGQQSPVSANPPREHCLDFDVQVGPGSSPTRTHSLPAIHVLTNLVTDLTFGGRQFSLSTTWWTSSHTPPTFSFGLGEIVNYRPPTLKKASARTRRGQ